MSYNLFLDDWRVPDTVVQYSNKPDSVRKNCQDKEWEIARTYKEFIKIITEKGLPEMISFDHDLNDEYHFIKDLRSIVPIGEVKIDYASYEEKTGYHAAKWVADYCMDHDLPLPEYQIHSDNPAGSANIFNYLENFKKQWQSSKESGIRMDKSEQNSSETASTTSPSSP